MSNEEAREKRIKEEKDNRQVVAENFEKIADTLKKSMATYKEAYAIASKAFDDFVEISEANGDTTLVIEASIQASEARDKEGAINRKVLKQYRKQWKIYTKATARLGLSYLYLSGEGLKS